MNCYIVVTARRGQTVLLSLDHESYALGMRAMKERLLWRYTVTNQLV
jgi:hypothetical protein